MPEPHLIERVKGYWNGRPCNIRHSSEPVGTKAYFEQVEKRKYFVEPHIPAFARFERWREKKVLEIGCGMGTDTINFARAGAQVTAVDISSASLALARERAKVFGLADRIRFVECNSEELSAHVRVETYDLVYSFGVIHHTPHPDRVISEVRKYLGPKSEFRLMLYYRFSWKVFCIMLANKGRFWDIDALVAKHSEAQEGCPVTYSYSRRTAGRLLSEQHISVEHMFVEHIFPYEVAAYRRYRYRMVPWFRILPRPVFRALERTIGWHLCIVGKLD